MASAESVTQTFLAAPMGSFLFAWMVITPFISSAAGYLLAALLIMSITGNLRPAPEGKAPDVRTTIRPEIGEGLRWLRGHALLRGLAVIVGPWGAAATMASSLLVLYVVDILGLPVSAFALFLVSAGVGGLLGGLAAPRIGAKLGRIATLCSARRSPVRRLSAWA